jgi:hypothetical protein
VIRHDPFHVDVAIGGVVVCWRFDGEAWNPASVATHELGCDVDPKWLSLAIAATHEALAERTDGRAGRRTADVHRCPDCRALVSVAGDVDDDDPEIDCLGGDGHLLTWKGSSARVVDGVVVERSR